LYRESYNAPVPEYFCYIIECADGSFYTGWSTNPIPQRREFKIKRLSHARKEALIITCAKEEAAIN